MEINIEYMQIYAKAIFQQMIRFITAHNILFYWWGCRRVYIAALISNSKVKLSPKSSQMVQDDDFSF